MTSATTDAPGTATDAQKTLAYGSGRMGRKFMQIGLVCVAACGALVWLQPRDFSTPDWAMTSFGLAIGAACTLYGLDRMLRPKSLLVLSPAGVQVHIDTLKTFLIPWHEVKGIDAIDITGTFRRAPVTFSGVTVVLVSRAFYDRQIHVDSWVMRGPGWDFNFVPRTDTIMGDVVQVALHHEALPVTAAELREAVTARWHAFRDATPADPKPASARVPRIFGGFRPK